LANNYPVASTISWELSLNRQCIYLFCLFYNLYVIDWTLRLHSPTICHTGLLLFVFLLVYFIFRLRLLYCNKLLNTVTIPRQTLLHVAWLYAICRRTRHDSSPISRILFYTFLKRFRQMTSWYPMAGLWGMEPEWSSFYTDSTTLFFKTETKAFFLLAIIRLEFVCIYSFNPNVQR